MTQITVKKYQANSGFIYSTPEEALRDDETTKRINDYTDEVIKEREILILDIQDAYKNAFDQRIIDTMGNPHYRALFYMKNICQKFADKHKDVRMI